MRSNEEAAQPNIAWISNHRNTNSDFSGLVGNRYSVMGNRWILLYMKPLAAAGPQGKNPRSTVAAPHPSPMLRINAGTDTVSHYIAGTVTESGSQNWCRQCGQQIAEDDEDGRTDDKLFRDDGWVVQWETDGHTVVLSRDQKGRGLHGKGHNHDEHLQKAAHRADGLHVEPEDEQHLPELSSRAVHSLPP
ncbi:hypothetical protein MJG53_011469 [Ovis ammon polii x Ovis aries]|uniref:Uncharacterized protein n=1 Tax=Ovis ammon polii x Ovis aries TaxID=2918886 RepID=A0ACB9UNG3_9CETA|nr:hypothetical protein MJG53_011469 [Ovis ammon polii x Ovis aries]